MTRLLLVLMVVAGSAGSASPEDGPSPARVVAVGANPTTLEFVRSTIDFHTGHAGSARYKTLTDADLYRQLLAGRLDVVSVFGRPGQLGVEGFAKGFRRPPEQLVVGHLACMVVVPASRKIDRLILAQLADVVAGKTTTWDRLGAGTGSIEVRADPAALAVLQLRTGVRPAKGLVLADRGDTGENVYLSVLNRAVQRSRPAAGSAAKPDILGLASAASLLDGRHDWKYARLVPVAAKERDEAVTPSLANVREETYPLSTTWRILVHPDAPPRAAGFAKLCLRGYEGLCNAGYVLAWLVQPRQDELGNVVRLFGLGGYFGHWRENVIDSLLGAYRKSRPDVTVGRGGFSGPFLDADLLHGAGRLSPYDREKLLPIYDGKIPEQVIGYQPLLVLVHPSCPVRQMTLAQVRRIAEQDVTRWSQVGWANEEAPVVKRARARRILQGSLFDRETQRSNGGAGVRALVRLDHLSDASMLQEAKSDTHGVTFALASDAALASGLKVLAITDSKGRAVANWSQCYRYVADEGLRGSDSVKVPAGMDHEKAARIYLRESVRCLGQYTRRFVGGYDDPKERRGTWWGFQSLVAFYQRELATYLAETDAPPAEVDREVDQWARLLDRRPELGAPSEILRLQVLTLKKDRAGFLAALTGLQKAHPDPKSPYWARRKGPIRRQMEILFPESAGRDNNFLAWLEGRRGPGSLPFDGYDPTTSASESRRGARPVKSKK